MNNYNFDVEKTHNELIQWIRNWFKNNGNNTFNVVNGLSSGKDSLLTLALLVEALGPERVIGVGLPQDNQGLKDSKEQADYFGVEFIVCNIGPACKAIVDSIPYDELTVQTVQNIPPRIRMTTLYAIAQSNNAVVVNNCNCSENYIGYSTLFGDGAGSFSPLHELTVTEIYQLIDYMQIPKKFVHIPDDGLPHSKPDEDKFGFTYAELDKYIREGIEPVGYVHNNENEGLKIDKIKRMHNINQFKLRYMDYYSPSYLYS